MSPVTMRNVVRVMRVRRTVWPAGVPKKDHFFWCDAPHFLTKLDYFVENFVILP